jgi:predicted metalloprotease with PDZ domain
MGAARTFLALLVTFGQATAAEAPAPRDRAHAGAIELRVDLSDVDRRIFRVQQTVPASPGVLTLLYPQWLPGNHAPRGPIEQLAGLRVRAGGRALDWQRDPLNVYAFRVRVPAGAREVQLEFEVATPQASDQGRVVVTSKLLGLQWNQVLLYPDGFYARRIPVDASVRLPRDWTHASSLPVRAPAGAPEGWVRFATVPLEQLVDSPLFAGAYGSRVDLAPASAQPVRLNVFAEAAADIAVTPSQLESYRALVRETRAALGPPRFDRYDFLLALSDSFGGIGLEHLRSSENSHPPGHFRDWDEDVGGRDLLAHEYVHSWNGKYRRPARLWTPAYNNPMQDDLLWVYEGLTEYYGMVLTARSGLWSADFYRAALASVAALYDRRRPGRAWRPLEDTTYQPVITPRRPLSWPSWQRSEDYYSESVLLWLEVEMRLRELSGGERGLDEFARTFFAARPTQGEISTYEFADVVGGLRAVAPFDWQDLLRKRVGEAGQPVAEGFERAGWRLVYDDKPNEFIRDAEKSRRNTDLSYSLGITVNREGVLTEVVWDGPAFKAGLTINTSVVAVQGRAFTAELLKDAIVQAARGGEAIELIVKNLDRFRTVRIDYRDGLRYPRLERIEGREDRLQVLLQPRAATP